MTEKSTPATAKRTPVSVLDDQPNTTPVSHLPENLPAGLRDYLNQTPGLSVNFEDAEAAWEAVNHGARLQAQGAIVSGYALTWLKTTLGHGEFNKQLGRARIQPRAAQRWMAAYKFAQRLLTIDPVALPKLAELGMRKMLAFQDWDDEEIAKLLHDREVRGLNYDQVKVLSASDVEQDQRKWHNDHDLAQQRLKAENKRLREGLEIAENEKLALRERLEQRREDPILPPWYTIARNDVLRTVEETEQYLAKLRQYAEQHVLQAPQSNEHEIQLSGMLASLLYHDLAGVIVGGKGLLVRLVDHFGEGIADPDQVFHLRVDDDELQMLAERRAEIVRLMELQHQQHQTDRRLTQVVKRGPGRPRKHPKQGA